MKKIILALLVTTLVFQGCMKNSELNDGAIVPLSLRPSVGEEPTKALIDGTTITGESIRVHISKSDGTTSYLDPADAMAELSNGGASWSLTPSIYISSDNATLYAYAPYSGNPADETGSYSSLKRLLDIPATIDMANQVDYLWGTQSKTTDGGADDINNSNPNVTLTLNHALTQISFVVWKENFAGTGTISSITLTDLTGANNLIVNKAVTNDLAMAAVDGTITGGDKSATYTVTNVGKTISITSDPGTNAATLKTMVDAYFLIPPFTLADKANLQFTFNIDSKDYNVSLSSGAFSWLAGKQYIYKVKLTGSQMTLQSVTVTDWDASYEGDVIIQ